MLIGAIEAIKKWAHQDKNPSIDVVPKKIGESKMLIDSIKSDWKAARLARDTTKATTLGTLVGAIQTKEKTFSPERPLTDEEVVVQVKKLLDGVQETKTLVESRADYPNRDEILAKAQAEIDTLSVYMPQQLSEADLEAFVRAKMAEGVNAIGQLMKALKEAHAGSYDGKLASEVIKRLIG